MPLDRRLVVDSAGLRFAALFAIAETFLEISAMMDVSVRQRLGTQIQRERLRRGLRLVDVAHRIGRQAARISEIETGKANSTIDTLVAVGASMGLELVFVPRNLLRQYADGVDIDTRPTEVGTRVVSVLEEVFIDDSVDCDDEDVSDHDSSGSPYNK